MLLSIIIPVYNVEKYITENLQLLHNITKSEIEFIIINDGSTDKTPQICSNYTEIDKRFKLINKNNGGVSSARNLGIANAIGDYLFFIDGDDIISDRFIDSIFTCINRNLDFVFFKRWFIKRNCIEFDYKNFKQQFKFISNKLYQITDLNKILLNKFFCSGSGEILIKRQIINNIRFDEKRSLLEDFDFFFKIIYHKNPQIYFYDEIITKINDNVPNSLTRKIIPFHSLPPLLSYTNDFLLNNHEIQLRVFWIETYFHLKKISFKERFSYLQKRWILLIKNIQLNKYFIGSIFFILNLDINFLRIHLKKITNKIHIINK